MSVKHNTIGKGEKQRAVNGGNDAYFTKQHIADYYSHIVLEKYGEVDYIEPCAGAGAFMSVLPDVTGFDLIPKRDDIVEMDVFNNTFTKEQVIVSNPPFGMSASLAMKIFNHIASFEVKAICFIVPKSFKKNSTKNKLDSHYHLTFEQDVIDNAFTVEGVNKNVPCVFQIWEYKKTERKKVINEKCKWFDYVTKENANISVRRVGGKAGQILDGIDHSDTTTYFIKTKHKMVKKALQLINLSVVNNTAGVRSISKSELCYEVNKIMEILG